MSTDLIRKWLDADANYKDESRRVDEAQSKRDSALRIRNELEAELSKLVGANIQHRLFVADGVHVLVQWTPSATGGFARLHLIRPETR